MSKLRLSVPAKINLFLAVTGRRADGFHELVSLVAPLDICDTLTLETKPGLKGDTLACAEPGVPTDATNLVLKAAAAFRRRAGKHAPPHVHFKLTKAIPSGAGLGGGSSDAAAALTGLNKLAKKPLSSSELCECAAEAGSDVPLFLAGGPIIMRGRGESIEPVVNAAAKALRGHKVLVFKPSFGVPTAWAYKRLREGAPDSYTTTAKAEKQMASWLAVPDWATIPLHNDIEPPVFEKFPALPALLVELRKRFGLRCAMSGSGSACFALLEKKCPLKTIERAICDAWGKDCFVCAAALKV